MNWNLIVRLSFFGFLMGWASISLLSESIEVALWILIYAFCAYAIAKKCEQKHFLNGLMLSMLNSAWVTGFHVIFYKTYLSEHPAIDLMYSFLPLSGFPRLGMVMMAPVFGAFFGVFLGLFSFIASKIVDKPTQKK